VSDTTRARRARRRSRFSERNVYSLKLGVLVYGIVCIFRRNENSVTTFAYAAVTYTEGDSFMGEQSSLESKQKRGQVKHFISVCQFWLVQLALKVGLLYRLKSTYLPIVLTGLSMLQCVAIDENDLTSAGERQFCSEADHGQAGQHFQAGLDPTAAKERSDTTGGNCDRA
jgi:hypothetical protein